MLKSYHSIDSQLHFPQVRSPPRLHYQKAPLPHPHLHPTPPPNTQVTVFAKIGSLIVPPPPPPQTNKKPPNKTPHTHTHTNHTTRQQQQQQLRFLEKVHGSQKIHPHRFPIHWPRRDFHKRCITNKSAGLYAGLQELTRGEDLTHCTQTHCGYRPYTGRALCWNTRDTPPGGAVCMTSFPWSLCSNTCCSETETKITIKHWDWKFISK